MDILGKAGRAINSGHFFQKTHIFGYHIQLSSGLKTWKSNPAPSRLPRATVISYLEHGFPKSS